MEMTPKMLTNWIKALLSGEYVQGTGSLHPNESYCCLGVLGDLQGIEWDKRYQGRLFEAAGDVDLPEYYACGMSYDFMDALAEMNDGSFISDPHSFEEIATYLEDNREMLITGENSLTEQED